MTATYPPPQHVLRDLRLEMLKTAVDHAFVWAPVQPHATADNGALRLGVLGTMIDSAGAVIALGAATPDWIATADLGYRTIAPVREGPVIMTSRLVRAGATIIVIGVDVYDGKGSEAAESGTPCGTGLMTFSRIPASASAAKVDPFANIGVRTSNALPDSRIDVPLHEKIGLRVIDAERGVVEIDKHDYVRNSFGTINGGAICMVFEAAAEHAARAAGGRPYVAADLSVHYLSQTKTGPARTAARVLRHDDAHAVCELSLVDTGNDDQLLALANVTLTA
ncbi:MAG TPA: hotdog domain-containing protein [Acidimicrobiales bacterium]